MVKADRRGYLARAAAPCLLDEADRVQVSGHDFEDGPQPSAAYPGENHLGPAKQYGITAQALSEGRPEGPVKGLRADGDGYQQRVFHGASRHVDRRLF